VWRRVDDRAPTPLLPLGLPVAAVTVPDSAIDVDAHRTPAALHTLPISTDPKKLHRYPGETQLAALLTRRRRQLRQRGRALGDYAVAGITSSSILAPFPAPPPPPPRAPPTPPPPRYQPPRRSKRSRTIRPRPPRRHSSTDTPSSESGVVVSSGGGGAASDGSESEVDSNESTSSASESNRSGNSSNSSGGNAASGAPGPTSPTAGDEELARRLAEEDQARPSRPITRRVAAGLPTV